MTYAAIFPYIQILDAMLQEKYDVSKDNAGMLYTTPYYFSAVFTPFFGLIIDKIGRRPQFIVLSSFCMALAHLISAFLPSSKTDPSYFEMIPCALIGFGYTIYASCLWGCIPYVVEPSTVGSAFGLCTAV
jgi:MFS family permease